MKYLSLVLALAAAFALPISAGAKNGGGGGGAKSGGDKVAPSEVKANDKASPNLTKAAASGTHYKKASIAAKKTGSTGTALHLRKAGGGGPVEY